ncbi:hypothetical protein [Ruania alba]|uniref:Uncharacterized protein n=1 Tax=Ruania alba TaxID=648782 RepID=A0A1H5M362_9MICO|nr:hypothetical protein [Ruania alba]SEE83736.1 hypothetical protein SAMN04488554_3125 [Ruania alba]
MAAAYGTPATDVLPLDPILSELVRLLVSVNSRCQQTYEGIRRHLDNAGVEALTMATITMEVWVRLFLARGHSPHPVDRVVRENGHRSAH